MAQALLKRMETAGVRPNDVTYNALMSKQSTAEGMDSTMKAMAKRGIEPATTSYNIMLRGIVNNNVHPDMEHARGLVDKMLALGVRPDVHTYGLLIKGYSKCQDPDAAFDALYEMRDRGLRVTTKVLTPLIMVCATDSKGEEPNSTRVLEIEQMMAEEGIQHNLISATAMIRVLGQGGQADQAMTLFEQLQELGPQPSTRTYNTLINATIFSRHHLHQLLELVREMPERGVKPDVRTFNKLIHNCSQAQQLEMAFSMPAVMRNHGLEPSLRTYHNLIRAAYVNRHYKEAIGLLDELKKQKLKPTTTTYNLLFPVAKREGADAVMRLYDRMQRDGLQVNSYTTSFLVAACIEKRLLRTGYGLLMEAMREAKSSEEAQRRLSLHFGELSVAAHEQSKPKLALLALYQEQRLALGEVDFLPLDDDED